MLAVTAFDLEKWAETYPAKFELPRLISRLIWTTCSDIRRLDMLGGEHGYLSGFDGIVECDRGNAFVPPCLSVWELGTEKKVTWKANKDYHNRTQNSGYIVKNQAVFVFATPRRWTKCEKWVVHKNAEGIWKEVRGLWSQHLERWFDTAPWVAVSFARSYLGKNVAGFRTIEMIWKDYAHIPSSSGDQLSPNFVLSGRDRNRDDFTKWLTSDTLPTNRIIRFSGPSKREAMDFIAATIHSLGEPTCTHLGSRVFTVDNIDSAQCLHGVAAEHTILATGEVIPYAVRISRQTACKVVILHANDNEKDPQPMPDIPCIELQPMARDAMIRVVIQVGYSDEEAARICEVNSFDYEEIRKAIFLY